MISWLWLPIVAALAFLCGHASGAIAATRYVFGPNSTRFIRSREEIAAHIQKHWDEIEKNASREAISDYAERHKGEISADLHRRLTDA